MLFLNCYHLPNPIGFRSFGGMAISKFKTLPQIQAMNYSEQQNAAMLRMLDIRMEPAKTPVFGTTKTCISGINAHVRIKRKTLLPLFTFSFNYIAFLSIIYIFSLHHFHCNHFHFQLFFHVNMSSCFFR